MEVFTNNWNSRKYQIGYALSGGFIKGFAHLGVMQALLEHDIKPDIISGVSAGALAGVFYADGNEPHQVIEYFSGHKFQDLTKLVIPKKGLFDLCEFIDFLHTNLKAKNLEELQIPLIITATDLDHGSFPPWFHSRTCGCFLLYACHVCSGQYRRNQLRRWRINDEPSGLHPSQNMRQGGSRQRKSHHGARL